MGQRRTESFLLRLVVEENAPTSRDWRGRVQHVASGREQRFSGMYELLAFVRSQCADMHSYGEQPRILIEIHEQPASS